MDRKYKVGGYVKLAKLWERSKDAAVAYHSSYYAEKFREDADKRLVGVYIDITGNKEIYKRPEMVHLLKDCKKGAVNLIFSQTRAYLAANTCDFCFLLKYLFDLPMRLLREECRHEFWASYEPASDNSGGKPENECWERCYPCSWKSSLYLRFAEERSEGYCNHAVCCGASHVL